MHKMKRTEGYRWSAMGALARGHMGDIFKGTCLRTGRRVAVKEYDETPAAMEELATLKAINIKPHRNIVKILGIEKESVSGLDVLVSEYCNGGNLQQMLDHPTNFYGLQESQLLGLLFNIGQAIQELRSQNIVHGQIRPGHILCHKQEDGSVVYKLADFGAMTRESPQASCGMKEYLGPNIHGGAFAVLERSDAHKDVVHFMEVIRYCATGKPLDNVDSGFSSGPRPELFSQMTWLSRDTQERIVQWHGQAQLGADILPGIVSRGRSCRIIHAYNLTSGQPFLMFGSSARSGEDALKALVARQTDIPEERQVLFKDGRGSSTCPVLVVDSNRNADMFKLITDADVHVSSVRNKEQDDLRQMCANMDIFDKERRNYCARRAHLESWERCMASSGTRNCAQGRTAIRQEDEPPRSGETESQAEGFHSEDLLLCEAARGNMAHPCQLLAKYIEAADMESKQLFAHKLTALYISAKDDYLKWFDEAKMSMKTLTNNLRALIRTVRLGGSETSCKQEQARPAVNHGSSAGACANVEGVSASSDTQLPPRECLESPPTSQRITGDTQPPSSAVGGVRAGSQTNPSGSTEEGSHPPTDDMSTEEETPPNRTSRPRDMNQPGSSSGVQPDYSGYPYASAYNYFVVEGDYDNLRPFQESPQGAGLIHDGEDLILQHELIQELLAMLDLGLTPFIPNYADLPLVATPWLQSLMDGLLMSYLGITPHHSGAEPVLQSGQPRSHDNASDNDGAHNP